MPKRPRPRPRPAGLIAELPLDERPRERLLRNGPKALTDAELVAILLKNGRPGASVLEVARELLVSAGGLPGLAGASPQEIVCASRRLSTSQPLRRELGEGTSVREEYTAAMATSPTNARPTGSN